MTDFQKAIIRLLNGFYLLAVFVAVIWTLLQISGEMRANRAEGMARASRETLETALEQMSKDYHESQRTLQELSPVFGRRY